MHTKVRADGLRCGAGAAIILLQAVFCLLSLPGLL